MSLFWSILLSWTAALTAASAMVTLYGRVFLRPRVWRQPPRDMLVLAPHQDDCAIMAGESVMTAVEAGKSVTIVYVTCGADHPGHARADVRRAECIAVWQSVGVPRERLHFLDLPQSAIGQPSSMTPGDEALGCARLSEFMRQVPARADVFFPAAHEMHVDHQTVRGMTLAALRAALRPDLTVLEAPLYNVVYSLGVQPAAALRWVLGRVPVVSRLVPRCRLGANVCLAGPGRSYRLPANAERLERKNDLYRGFKSEDPALLRRLFGAPTGSVRWSSRRGASPRTPPARLVRVGRYDLAPSVFLLIAAVAALVLLAGAAAGAGTAWLVRGGWPHGRDWVAAWGVLASSLPYLWRRRGYEVPYLVCAACGWVMGIYLGLT